MNKKEIIKDIKLHKKLIETGKKEIKELKKVKLMMFYSPKSIIKGIQREIKKAEKRIKGLENWKNAFIENNY